MFDKRLINETISYVNRKTKEVQNRFEDFTDEEALDFLKETGGDIYAPVQEGPHEELEFKELIEGITKLIKKQRDADKILPVFFGTLQGMANKEIAQELGVSPAIITRRFKQRLTPLLIQYGEDTGNDSFVKLIAEFSKTKKHADKDVSFLFDVFEEYKRRFSNSTEQQKPKGQVTRIQKTNLGADKMSEDFIFNAILGENKSSSEMEDDLDAFLSALADQDEVVDTEDGLIGLRVVDNHRSEDARKAYKAGAVKQLMLQVEEWFWRNEGKKSKKQLIKEAMKKFMISEENAEYVWNEMQGGDGADFLGIKNAALRGAFDHHDVDVTKQGPFWHYSITSYQDGNPPLKIEGKGAQLESLALHVTKMGMEMGGTMDVWVDKQPWMLVDFVEKAIRFVEDTPDESLIPKMKKFAK